MHGDLACGSGESALKRWLRAWPVDRPRNWLAEVNRPMHEDGLRSVRQSVTRGVPLGGETWKDRIAKHLGLDISLKKEMCFTNGFLKSIFRGYCWFGIT